MGEYSRVSNEAGRVYLNKGTYDVEGVGDRASHNFFENFTDNLIFELVFK